MNIKTFSMSEMEELAKAIQASASFGEKGLETANKAGGFLAKVLKEPTDEIVGMITDKLRFLRWQRIVQMSDELNIILMARGVSDTRNVPAKIALPIIEEASLENDPALKPLWNNLLANAMDPGFNGDVRFGFVDMIKNITGLEARLLQLFYEVLAREHKLIPLSDVYKYNITKEELIRVLGSVTLDNYAVAVNNLMRMQLVSPAILKGGMMLGSEPLTIYKGIDAITMTALGVKFVEACIK